MIEDEVLIPELSERSYVIPREFAMYKFPEEPSESRFKKGTFYPEKNKG